MPEEKIDWTKIAERKIFVYEIKYRELKSEEENAFHTEYIDLLLSYMKENLSNFNMKLDKENKYFGIESIVLSNSCHEIILKNCKYNFTPDIINVDTQKEHKSSKAPNEGDKEKTHVLIKNNKVYYENKRNGSSLYIFRTFISKAFKEIRNRLPSNINQLVFSQVLDNSFFDILKNAKKIKSTKMIVSSKLINSEYFNFSNDDGVQDNYSIEIKAKKRNQFNKQNFIKKMEWLFSENKEIEKISVDICDEDNNLRVINTDEFAKFYKIYVDRTETGEINSRDMFDKMEGLEQ